VHAVTLIALVSLAAIAVLCASRSGPQFEDGKYSFDMIDTSLAMSLRKDVRGMPYVSIQLVIIKINLSEVDNYKDSYIA
jgi:hypothetical protein